MKSLTLLTAGVIALTAGVADAGVRVIHGSPDAPAVDVFVNTTPGMGDPAIEDLAFTQGTSYIGLPTGNYNFQVTPAGVIDPVVIDADVFIDATMDYTVVASGFLADIAPSVYVDDNTIDADNARVRFIHQSPDAPMVDVFADGVGAIFDDVSFTESGGYITVDGGSYDLDVRLQDGTVALDDISLDLQDGFVYTVFAFGSVADGTLQAVAFVDAVIPAPGAMALLGLAGLAGTRRRRA